MAASKNGTRKGTAKPRARRTPSGSWADRITLGRQIAELKDGEGLTWVQVAERIGRPKTTCERLYKQARASGVLDPPVDAWSWVHRFEDTLALALELIEETYQAAPAGSPQAIGAIKQLIVVGDKQFELARWIGRTPRQPGALTAGQAMQDVLREMAAIVERYDAPDEMIHAFLELAELHMSGQRVIEVEGTAAGA